MLKKQNRLKSDFEYKVTKKYGKRFSYETFSWTVCKPLNHAGDPKVGIVVPNSIHKSAAKRNRIKRLFREAVRKHLGLIPMDYWAIIYPKNTSLNATYEKIDTDIYKAIQEVFITK